MATLVGHTGAVRALTATDSTVFSGSDDTTIRAWDATTLQCLGTLAGHEDNVRVLASGNGYLFSGSWDKTVRVWSVESLTCQKVLEGHNEAVLALAVGDTFLVSGSYDSTLRWVLGSWRGGPMALALGAAACSATQLPVPAAAACPLLPHLPAAPWV